MEFHDKLNFLMNITKTTNNSLAMTSSLDPSYISLLRNGKRRPVKEATYLVAFAQFFSKRLHLTGQMKVFREVLLPYTLFPENEGDLANFLYHWLVNNNSSLDHLRHSPMKKLTDAAPKENPCENLQSDMIPFSNITCGLYRGIQERRLAAVHFLGAILNQNTPRTLLFFSDEDMSWMTGDPIFYQKWSQLMGQLVAKGNRIKIIHDITRGLDEILASIQLWVPLYLSGAIEPFYYPRKRDGIYKRSLYIAPGLCAVSSTSIGTMTADESTAVFHQDLSMIQELENEFNHYLSLCRPLMSIFTPDQHQNYLSLLESFEKEQASTLLKTPHLSMLSMPEPLMESVLLRYYQTSYDGIQSFYRKRLENFRKSLKRHAFTEIFSIPKQDNLLAGKTRINLPDPFESIEGYYTPEDYRQHLDHVAALIKRYGNYNVCIEKKECSLGYSLYAKESTGIIVAKNTMPAVVLFIQESNLFAGFWDFLLELKEQNEGQEVTCLNH
ncbi:MAG: hypothetical protein GX115_10720 [Ruminiclostridium sp.]|nr:hypothetical protein [Ruminiclostridium sp.]